jgi:Mg-chelatase subunit ChlD
MFPHARIVPFLCLLAWGGPAARAQTADPCAEHAEARGRSWRLRSADGGVHDVEELRCYPDFLYARRDGRWAVLDGRARFRTDFRFDHLEAFDRGLAAVRVGDRQGYIDARGREVIPIRFIKIRPLGERRFLARDTAGWWLFARDGRRLHDTPYDKVSAFYDGYAVTRAGERFGLLAEDGRELAPPRYDEIHKFFEGYAMVSRGGKWGHLDTAGREAIPLVYDEVFVFYEGLALARKGDRWGYINRRNEAVLPFVYDYVEHFEQGRALVSRNGRWGYIARDGRALIPLAWDRIHPFQDGMAKVEQDGRQGYLAWNGDTLVPPVYDEIYRFRDGLAFTRRDGRFGLIDARGRVLSPPVWDAVQPFRGGVAVVERGGRSGLVNREAEVLVPPEYDAVQVHADGSVSVRRDGAWMYVDALPGEGPVPLDPGQAARIRLGDQWGFIDQFGQAFGFTAGPVEFVDTHADLGRLPEDRPAEYTFHYRNAGEAPLRLEGLETPCGCRATVTPSGPLEPGAFGQIHLDCSTWGVDPEWRVTVPARFSALSEPVPLHLAARREVPDSARALVDAVPVNGRYVFLLDISASMDELPLAKMVFTRLAASLCRDDNISIVSFNSFSKVELRPTENHAEVVNTIRRLHPALKTDAARGLRLGFQILREPGAVLEKHLYMASDGDLDPEALRRVLERHGSPEARLTVFVFSYTGDRTDYDRLVASGNLPRVRYVYVDRENIAEVLELEYTDIGCLPPERAPVDTLRYRRVDEAAFDGEAPPGLYRIRERRRFGLVDAWDNLVLPPVYEALDHAGEGLVRTRLGRRWRLWDGCAPLVERAYDTIGRFERGRALARRDSVAVLLDRRGREYDYLPELADNPLYPDPAVLDGMPFANLTLLLDLSASMDRPDKLPLLQETFRHFSGILRYEDRVGVVSYTNAAEVVLPPVPAWQRRRLVEAVDGLRSRGATRVQEGLALAYTQALQGWIPEGNNRVILATDGRFEATPELLALLDRYRRRGLHLTVYLFGEDRAGSHAEALAGLAERAGGRFVHVDPDSMAAVLLEEMRAAGEAGRPSGEGVRP